MASGWNDGRRPGAGRLWLSHQKRGAVLLEAVLALAVLMLAVGLLAGAMQHTVPAVQRMEAEMVAENLAVSVLSEIEAGIRPRQSSGPQPFESPWAEWRWEVEVDRAEQMVAPRLDQIMVRVSHGRLAIQHELRHLFVRPADPAALP